MGAAAAGRRFLRPLRRCDRLGAVVVICDVLGVVRLVPHVLDQRVVQHRGVELAPNGGWSVGIEDASRLGRCGWRSTGGRRL
jgi:hypothetical protein